MSLFRLRRPWLKKPKPIVKTLVLRTLKKMSIDSIGFEDPAREQAELPQPVDPGSVGAWQDSVDSHKQKKIKIGLSDYKRNSRK